MHWNILTLPIYRFLLEQHEFPELEDMCNVNLEAVSTMHDYHNLTDIRSSIPSHLGQLHMRSGNAKKALPGLQDSLDIRLEDSLSDLGEVSWGESNLGQACFASGDLETAFQWHDRSHKTWARWAESQPESAAVPRFQPTMNVSMGRLLLYMGRYDEAVDYLEPTLREFRKDSAAKLGHGCIVSAKRLDVMYIPHWDF